MARPSNYGSKSIKDILLERQLISMEDARRVEESPDAGTKSFQQIAVEMGVVDKTDTLQALSKEWRHKAVNLDDVDVDAESVRLISESIARENLIIPFAREEDVLLLAMADPLNFSLVEDIHTRTGMEVRCYIAMPGDITRELDKVYGGTPAEGVSDEVAFLDAAEQRTKEMLESLRDTEDIEVDRMSAATDVLEVDASAPEVEKIINATILAALQQRASDIHFEPFQDSHGKKSRMIVRLRVDGFLKEAPFKIPWSFRNAILAKIKIMTGTMNITERRIPQSGRIQVMAKGRPLEFRVETIPTIYGESASLRLLDRKNVNVEIPKLGFMPDIERKLLDQLKGVGGKKNYGMVLVTGPTGSGKSTTLYACLNHLNRPSIRIVTAENPVEYNIDGIIQVPVNPDIKLGADKRFDFAMALRSFLRLDPDVIMVGEIRDQETARIAMEAAMTGHLVFATLHTNDAPSAVSRLAEMGLPSYMVIGTVKCIVAQRLTRAICNDCRQSRSPSPEELEVFKAQGFNLPPDTVLYQGRGCATCGQTGYKGRTGMHELLIMDDVVRRSAMANISADNIRYAAIASSMQHMRTLVQDGLMKVLQGKTTVQEVLGEAIE